MCLDERQQERYRSSAHPFEIEDAWFALELVEYQVKVGPGARGAVAQRVEETIDQLGLNATECLAARREYVEAFREGHIRFEYLERRAPFIARELRRQGQAPDSE